MGILFRNGEALQSLLSVNVGASEHPLAEAIVRGAEERGVPMVEANDFEAVTGKGVTGVVDGRQVAGLVSVADPVKETTPAALKALHEQGCASSWRQATTPGRRRPWLRGLASTRSVPTCCPKTRPASSASCQRPGTARRWPGME